MSLNHGETGLFIPVKAPILANWKYLSSFLLFVVYFLRQNPK